MIASQLSTCEECRNGSCNACKRYKRRLARFKREQAAKLAAEIADYEARVDRSPYPLYHEGGL